MTTLTQDKLDQVCRQFWQEFGPPPPVIRYHRLLDEGIYRIAPLPPAITHHVIMLPYPWDPTMP